MRFIDFINESQTRSNVNYQEIDSTQFNIIRQSFDRNKLASLVNKEYIDKLATNDNNLKLVDSDFYISGMALYDSNKVVIHGMFIIEVTEDDGYVYYKPVEFEYVIDDSNLLSVNDIDRIRDENWKKVQDFVLRTCKKI